MAPRRSCGRMRNPAVSAAAPSRNGNATANYAVEIAATESSAVQLNNLVIDNGAGTNGDVASASSV